MKKFAVELEGKGCLLTEKALASGRLFTLNKKKKRFTVFRILFVMAEDKPQAFDAAIALLNSDPTYAELVKNVPEIEYKVVQSYDMEPDDDPVNDPDISQSPLTLEGFSFW